MKKYLLTFITLGLAFGLLLAQAIPAQTTPQPPKQNVSGFQGVKQYVDTQELIVEYKSMIPATGVFQDKSDTYQHAGKYNFNFNKQTLIENSDILLNKWLKESK
jgi:hypothetical protein